MDDSPLGKFTTGKFATRTSRHSGYLPLRQFVTPWKIIDRNFTHPNLGKPAVLYPTWESLIFGHQVARSSSTPVCWIGQVLTCKILFKKVLFSSLFKICCTYSRLIGVWRIWIFSLLSSGTPTPPPPNFVTFFVIFFVKIFVIFYTKLSMGSPNFRSAKLLNILLLEHVWNASGTYVYRVWNAWETCLEHVWNACGTFLKRLWNVCGTWNS
jgi:hypothetical protein